MITGKPGGNIAVEDIDAGSQGSLLGRIASSTASGAGSSASLTRERKNKAGWCDRSAFGQDQLDSGIEERASIGISLLNQKLKGNGASSCCGSPPV
jgi:hypothetical protein